MHLHHLPVFLSRWRFNPACHIRWRNSDDEYILYNESSGQTHYLNELGAEALRLLERHPFNAQELFAHFTTQYEDFLSDDTEALLYTQKILIDLDELGLIEPCSK